jgi:hypothetical protein
MALFHEQEYFVASEINCALRPFRLFSTFGKVYLYFFRNLRRFENSDAILSAYPFQLIIFIPGF